MRVGLYARVSTEDQARTGYSLQTQIDACEKNAPAESHIEKFIDDGFSGEFLDRPAMVRLRDEIKNKMFDMVICYDPDRLARNLAHQLIITDEIEKSGAQLKFVSVTFEHSPEGRLFYSIRGAVSAFEKEKIKERTNRGKKAKLASGKMLGRYNTYGYDWDEDNNNYKINEGQAKVVRLIFDLLLNEGYGTPKIAITLNARGIPGPKGGFWHPTVVHRTILRKAYCGYHQGLKYKYTLAGINQVTREKNNDNIIEVETPAIISLDTWNKAQRKLKQNTTLSKRNTKKFYLLQGILYCSICNRKMSSDFIRNRTYYYCQSKVLFNVEKCGNRYIPGDFLDDHVWNFLNELVDSKNKLKSFIAIPESSVSKEMLEQEESLIKKRSTILKWVDSNLITEADAEKRLKNIKVVLDEIKQKKEAPIKKEVVNLDEMIYSVKNATTPEAKRLVITKYIKKVFVVRIDTGKTPDVKIQIQF
ncbi:MAG: Resolvase protein [Firmicutes bacterium]|nr:Resolvase protein [Bacillota bacterium]